ncbi:MAG: hypothetical protein ALAOOOJD_02587 [bacterium]|nr:hypothetical protein [bacterium]
MNCDKMEIRRHDYVDGLLPAPEKLAFERHLATCSDCQHEVEFLLALRRQVAELPARIEPPLDLWPGIAKRTAPPSHWRQEALQRLKTLFGDENRVVDNWTAWGLRGAIAVAVLIVTVGGFWYLMQTRQAAWQVAPLAGAPQIGSQRLVANGQLKVGEWLETDDSSRAQLDIGLIGQVEIAPRSRLRLVSTRLTDHRLALARGKLHAEIWAPPRLFFVETASALAIDLGCEYTLEMNDDGFGLLHVTRGYVALENKQGPESVVPAGAFCEIRPGRGPGTPYSENASAMLRTALQRWDLTNNERAAIDTVLAAVREADSFTLWHLLFRVPALERPRVYDRMVELVSPPPGVTRDGVLQGDKRMLKLWADKFGLGQSWWRYWLPL